MYRTVARHIIHVLLVVPGRGVAVQRRSCTRQPVRSPGYACTIQVGPVPLDFPCPPRHHIRNRYTAPTSGVRLADIANFAPIRIVEISISIGIAEGFRKLVAHTEADGIDEVLPAWAPAAFV